MGYLSFLWLVPLCIRLWKMIFSGGDTTDFSTYEVCDSVGPPRPRRTFRALVLIDGWRYGASDARPIPALLLIGRAKYSKPCAEQAVEVVLHGNSRHGFTCLKACILSRSRSFSRPLALALALAQPNCLFGVHHPVRPPVRPLGRALSCHLWLCGPSLVPAASLRLLSRPHWTNDTTPHAICSSKRLTSCQMAKRHSIHWQRNLHLCVEQHNICCSFESCHNFILQSMIRTT